MPLYSLFRAPHGSPSHLIAVFPLTPHPPIALPPHSPISYGHTTQSADPLEVRILPRVREALQLIGRHARRDGPLPHCPWTPLLDLHTDVQVRIRTARSILIVYLGEPSACPTLPLSGPHLTPIWPLYDPYLAPIWPLSGPHLSLSKPSFAHTGHNSCGSTMRHRFGQVYSFFFFF